METTKYFKEKKIWNTKLNAYKMIEKPRGLGL